MKEFFLRRFFSCNELDIVHQQNINLAVPIAEAGGVMAANRTDQVVGELF